MTGVGRKEQAIVDLGDGGKGKGLVERFRDFACGTQALIRKRSDVAEPFRSW